MTASPILAFAALLIVFVLIVFVIALRLRKGDPQQRAVSRLLDAADALEARLRTARTEIEAITGTEDDTVRTALQEMLRQRLWLQQHGANASIRQLDEIRASIEQARDRIEQQLVMIERARLPLSPGLDKDPG